MVTPLLSVFASAIMLLSLPAIQQKDIPPETPPTPVSTPAPTPKLEPEMEVFEPSETEEVTVLADVHYLLTNRHKSPFVNRVFSDNILLTLAYMTKEVERADQIYWDKVRDSKEYRLELGPRQTFAFHDKVLSQYEDSVVATTSAHFNAKEGFVSSGSLYGDGVCHLASFMNVAALEAGLEVEAPTNHDFAAIPEVPREYGVSIYYSPTDDRRSNRQNLYITNTRDTTVAFVFTHDNGSLSIRVEEIG